MGILENRPFVLRDIMAFLVLEVLSSLEVDGVSQIFTLFKNVADGGRTPAVHIFESLVFIHTLAVLGKVSGRNEDFFFFQLAGDLIRTVALNRHGKDAPMKKDLLPGRWDTAVGGHVDYGETLEEALYREASEELGFRDFNPIFLKSYIWESAREKELVSVFATVGNFTLKPDNDEVTEGRYWNMSEIESNLARGLFTPNFEQEFKSIKDTLLALL